MRRIILFLMFLCAAVPGYAQTVDSVFAVCDSGVNADSSAYGWRNKGETLTVNRLEIGQTLVAGPTYYVQRGFTSFILSGLPNGQAIDSACISVNIYNDMSQTDFVLQLHQGVQYKTITASDFIRFSGFSFGQLDVYTMPVFYGSYNIAGGGGRVSIPLTSVGRGAITYFSQTTDTLKVAFLSSRDISATPPTNNEYVEIYNTQGAAGDVTKKIYLKYWYGGGGGGGTIYRNDERAGRYSPVFKRPRREF